ncbi:MAG TPA: AAA family ATPase [Candidatus Binatia bacterium]|nr:AAA family ATPase [Candidatus Binatia bacterium]
MERAAIRGQPAALAAAGAMLRRGVPHALLLSGPPGSGKTTLALDIAAALLCVHPDPMERPCRDCRACRLVARGAHPDLHRLAPGGAADQVKLKWAQADPRPGVLELIGELALSSVEGGPRVAIVERAHRMNDDAQNALLKTLEEPPAGVHLLLCTDDDDRLLPTIRSRCARIRLGTVGARDIEAWLVERGVADPPTAARLARLAEGRPGVALAYAEAPAATAARAEVDRVLLDLLDARPSVRLASTKPLLGRAAALTTALAGSAARSAGVSALPASGARRRRGGSGEVAEPAGGPAAAAIVDEDEAGAGEQVEEAQPVKSPASERRRAAQTLIEVWRALAIDLVRAIGGDLRRVHDPGLLEELSAVAGRLSPGPTAAFLGRLDRTALAVEGSASPELAIDALVIAWPHLDPVA